MNEQKKDKLALAEKMVKILVCVTVFLCLVALGLMGAAAWMQHASGSLSRMQSQMQSVKKTSEELESVIVVSQTLLNSGTADVTATISVAKLDESKSEVASEKRKLESEKTDLSATLTDIGTPVDRDAGNNAISLINKELLLIDRFEQTCEYSSPYLSLHSKATAALNKLVEADSADRNATSQLLAGNSDDAKKSIETANEAKALALEAKQMFEEVKQVNKEAAVSLVEGTVVDEYVTYCQLIADAQDAAVASANAYVARDKDELATQNDVYNKAKEKANAISVKWEKEITELLDEAFVQARAGEVDGFNQDLKERDSLFNSVANYLKGKNNAS